MYKVTLIPGDGVGPELAEVTRKCIDATGVKIDWDVQECGIEIIEDPMHIRPQPFDETPALAGGKKILERSQDQRVKTGAAPISDAGIKIIRLLDDEQLQSGRRGARRQALEQLDERAGR